MCSTVRQAQDASNLLARRMKVSPQILSLLRGAAWQNFASGFDDNGGMSQSSLEDALYQDLPDTSPQRHLWRAHGDLKVGPAVSHPLLALS